MMVCEQIMERIARHMGRPVHEVKALNMYEVRTSSCFKDVLSLCDWY